MKCRNFQVLIFALLILVVMAGCASQNLPAESADFSQRKINVVATIGMIANVAEIVGGERVEVVGLMGAGVDPHLYKASEGDVATLERADVIFFNGLHLEAGMSGVLERMTDFGKAVEVTESVDRETLMAPPEFEGAYDPHIWFDVTLWVHVVEEIRDKYIEMDPQHENVYRQNAEVFLEELDRLHGYVLEQVERVPEDKRVLITAHDAFNYFGRAYGFDVRGLQGISTETEASTKDVDDLAQFIAEREIPAVFVESSVPQRNIEAVQAAVQDKGFQVRIGGELFSDAMGDPGTVEGTYVGMVRHNINTIVNALLSE